ncbi:hypothetical protein P170DRAFT_202982 [Aspergillus steynii IBT 23096]|uniref:Uncharacterized protein n=1 Tax=Aspergillus steynii IBT 23096 TaxID=1392250 RepID=A0A2I2G589_9EURO|nr:uncharacterized protein P170DRAFT_202982 [Aspergillus steynii IBT 23096]PLB48013.1 hypothetical protein P170DRAFT_202982 [Aspergillus steynii IBT 23096]
MELSWVVWVPLSWRVRGILRILCNDSDNYENKFTRTPTERDIRRKAARGMQKRQTGRILPLNGGNLLPALFNACHRNPFHPSPFSSFLPLALTLTKLIAGILHIHSNLASTPDLGYTIPTEVHLPSPQLSLHPRKAGLLSLGDRQIPGSCNMDWRLSFPRPCSQLGY